MYFPDFWGFCTDNAMKDDTIYCSKSFELELKKKQTLFAPVNPEFVST